MIHRLLDVHNINISSVGSATAAAAVNYRTEQIKLCFGGSRGSSYSARISPRLSLTLNEDLTMWLAADTLPILTVDTPAFHTLFQRHVPNAKLPSSDTLRRTTLPKVYGDMKLRVSSCLQSVPNICLMFDGCSDRHNARHFLSIRAGVILDDWSSKVITLSCKECPQDSDGIKEHIASELRDFGLTDEILRIKQLFTTHDGASAMLKTSRLLNSKYSQHCCSHCLHLLLMTDGVNQIPTLERPSDAV